ncbi:MAG TPA: hypothetical protein VFT06_02230 [Flavisolibacter sp.]|nr:hypothetical protein [Flavisolibacter sp.]
MENTDTELSYRTASFFGWIEFLGLLLFFASRFFFRETAWLMYLGFLLVCSGYGYKLYGDWKAGRKKALRIRLFVLLLAIAAGLVVGYIAGKNR